MHDLAVPEPVELAPMQAKLQPLPAKIKRSKQHRAQTKPIPIATLPATGSPVAAPATAPISAVPIMEDLSAKRFSDERAYRPQLPARARLSYIAEYSGITIGESTHEFEIRDGRYLINAETRTRGIAGLLKPYRINQHSAGRVLPDGLQPESFSETRTDSNGTQTYTAEFNWTKQLLHFGNGLTQPLPEQTQDMLTLPYQLSQLPLSLETLPIASSNGRTLNRYFIAIGDETLINTPLGELRTIPLRKVRGADETGLIVWLALEYRLLPVKITLLDKSGAISANLLINDIRVSDE